MGTGADFVCPAGVDAAEATVGASLEQAAAERSGGAYLRTGTLRAADRIFPAATIEIIHTSTNTTRYRNDMGALPVGESDARSSQLAGFTLLKICRLETSVPLSVPLCVTVMTLPVTW